jgi:deoxyribodipyrimidine photo-lyase
MIQPQRIKLLNRKKKQKGSYVVYWMQASQRVACNHALEYAIRIANKYCVPVVVYFELIDNYPEANARHYFFMLEGLLEIKKGLEKLKISFVVNYLSEKKHTDLITLSQDALLVVTDRGYLSIQKKWRNHYAARLPCLLIQVESDVIVPVEIVSPKEEFSAATFRKKITPLLSKYLQKLKQTSPRKSSLHFQFNSYALIPLNKALSRLRIDHAVSPTPFYHGGTEEAKRHLASFLAQRIEFYAQLRNDPTKDFTSNLSPYLHFGQISPLFIALKVMAYQIPKGKDEFLEELIVRRELAINFVYYNSEYTSYCCLPDWAKKTLDMHKDDIRAYTYTLEELENAKTHDIYWNAAQEEMLTAGKMHGYMRMYWGKKILEWTKKPEEGFKIALYLNNKYELDGRDANGFTGVAWCFGKHDRAWPEREIFGKVRYMNAAGLKRKFDVEGYVEKVKILKRSLNNKHQ